MERMNIFGACLVYPRCFPGASLEPIRSQGDFGCICFTPAEAEFVPLLE